MKHHDTGRPIGKCKGCCLNSRTLCLAGLKPREVWSRGRCKSYNDNTLLDQVASRPMPTGAGLARLKRQARAEIAATEPHYNGVLDPSKMAGRSRRRTKA